MKGLIFSVKKYSVHDGPGIRVTFFMKGCPLNCLWCHNPEGISPYSTKINQPGRIGEKEFTHLEEVGKFYTAEDIIAILERDRVFMDHSGGGVTFSGGEPMLQPEFLEESLKRCKSNNYNTAIDTSGYVSPDKFIKVAPYTDLFLFDIKHLDADKHLKLTGVSNELILSNYRLLLSLDKEMMIRIPVIPGYNDDEHHIKKLRSFIEQTANEKLTKICLLPFHKTGASKYKKFSIPYRMSDTEQPSAERMKELKSFFSETGIKVKIGG
jgi:pyruvate formate lyase activating enzyme